MISSMLEQLKSEYGPRMPILLLSLEVSCIQYENANGREEYVLSLREIIRTTHLIEANHNLIMHYIHRLAAYDSAQASGCLEIYVCQRLAPEKKEEWTEQAIVSHIAVASNASETASATMLQTLERNLDQFMDAIGSVISSTAAQAAHVFV